MRSNTGPGAAGAAGRRAQGLPRALGPSRQAPARPKAHQRQASMLPRGLLRSRQRTARNWIPVSFIKKHETPVSKGMPHVLKSRKPGRGTTGNPCFVLTFRELDAQPSLVRASRGSEATVRKFGSQGRRRRQLSQTLRVRPAPKGVGGGGAMGGRWGPQAERDRARARRRGGCWSGSHGTP